MGIQAFSDLFKSKAMAAVIALPLAFGGAAGVMSSSPAYAQDQVATATANLPGKQVTLRVGPGFNPITADGLARVLRQEGCPATVTAERGFPKSLTVEVGDFKYKFREGEIGSANASALHLCQS